MYIAEGHIDEGAELVLKYHYSHRMPSNIQLVITWHEQGGLFGDLGECLAAVFYSIPPTRWSEEVWELSRLVRKNDISIQLSGLISKSTKIAKNKGIDLLVSFADYTQKHHGGIYQASSWNYAGKREKTMDGLIIDGIFKPGRSCNSIYGTRSPNKLKTKIDSVIEPHYDEGKYLYWKALSKEGIKKANRLNLRSLPYPKPGN